jgi:hypothetical protein
MDSRRTATAIGVVVAIAGIVLVARALRRPVEDIRNSVTAVVEDATPLPESVQTSAVDQVARVKGRGAVESMTSDLRQLVRVEQAYFAESLKYTTQLYCPDPGTNPPPGTVAYCASVGNTVYQPVVTWGATAGWSTIITNQNSAIGCYVVVGPDTTISHAPSGEPVCTSRSSDLMRIQSGVSK